MDHAGKHKKERQTRKVFRCSPRATFRCFPLAEDLVKMDTYEIKDWRLPSALLAEKREARLTDANRAARFPIKLPLKHPPHPKNRPQSAAHLPMSRGEMKRNYLAEAGTEC